MYDSFKFNINMYYLYLCSHCVTIYIFYFAHNKRASSVCFIVLLAVTHAGTERGTENKLLVDDYNT